ncbi:MAG: urease accessory protein UreD [Gemmataceae bacterium]
MTPPEFAGQSLSAQAAGTIGGVRVKLSAQSRVTRVAVSYQQVPLRVLPCYLDQGLPSLLYLINPTNGLMQGDGQLIDVDAGPDTRCLLVGQSATRLHPSDGSFCTQQWRLRLAAGALLVVLPGPTIPYQRARYYQRIEADLEPGAHLIWGDIWFAGRYARGHNSEAFRFDCLIQEMSLRRAGRSIYRDRFCWHGPWDESTSRWHFRNQPASGSLFATSTLQDDDGIPAGGRFDTSHRDTVYRWSGPAADVVVAVSQTALKLAPNRSEGTRWLEIQNRLAPVHWFHVH